MRCPQCDAVNQDNIRFCTECGQPLVLETPAPAAVDTTSVPPLFTPVPPNLPTFSAGKLIVLKVGVVLAGFLFLLLGLVGGAKLWLNDAGKPKPESKPEVVLPTPVTPVPVPVLAPAPPPENLVETQIAPAASVSPDIWTASPENPVVAQPYPVEPTLVEQPLPAEPEAPAKPAVAERPKKKPAATESKNPYDDPEYVRAKREELDKLLEEFQ